MKSFELETPTSVKITAIETGILTFEGAFLGQILLPSGKTVLEYAEGGGILKIESNQ